VIRKVVLNEYQDALRQIRRGEFEFEVPQVTDATLRSLGQDIAALAAGLEQRFEEIGRLQRISTDIGAGIFLEEILGRVYESFRGVIPFDRIGCALIDREARTLRARWARTESKQPRIGVGYTQSLVGSSLQRVIDTGEPRILNDLPQYLLEHPGSDSTRLIVEEGMHSSLTCPLIARGVPIGFVFFSSLQVGSYLQQHQQVFQQIAAQLSMVVEKSLLYEQLYTLNAELIETQRKLEHQAMHDVLTGLPNRRAVLEALDRELARAERAHEAFGVLVMDVDYFKRVNDTHGHAAGDAVLIHIGQVLARSCRAGELVGRFGGEEFLAIVMAGDPKSLAAAGERIRGAVAASTACWQGMSIPATVSIGAALYPGHGAMAADALIALADEGLYAAKAAGRNRVVCHPSPPGH
jgi:diguanylate cyclase (GGDEF)-like protein